MAVVGGDDVDVSVWCIVVGCGVGVCVGDGGSVFDDGFVVCVVDSCC